MIVVIKGDIIASRKIQDPEVWMNPLKALLSKWGDSPKDWDLVWDDFFQLEINEPITALGKALAIKALIKKAVHNKEDKSNGLLDVRLK